MSDQLTLDAYRNSDPETSRQAAEDAHVHAGTHRERVLAILRSVEDATDFELVDIYRSMFGFAPGQTSLGKRRGELRDLGLVEAARSADGGLVKRPAPSGSAAIAWKAVR